jgi:hypothetical protein
MRQYLAAATLAAIALAPVSTGAQITRDYGTAREARMMLQRVIGALQTDEAKALQLFNEGAPGFREADLYPYCGGPDGMFTAHPELMGSSLRELRDKRGNPLGETLYSIAKEGQIAQVTYYWPRPGSTDILRKVALVTRIGDQVCAVGYYMPSRRGKEAVP